ncbi:MAG: hypothetical protein R2827_14270 [Bdellovibrionales bacterium]
MEIHLGWAAHGTWQLAAELENFNESSARSTLKKVFNNKNFDKKIDEADTDSIKKFLWQGREGIHLATPVFDGAKETDVKDFLNRAEYPQSGQTMLFDGRTGEMFQTRDCRNHVYVETSPPRGRENSRTVHWSLLTRFSTAFGW